MRTSGDVGVTSASSTGGSLFGVNELKAPDVRDALSMCMQSHVTYCFVKPNKKKEQTGYFVCVHVTSGDSLTL